MITVDGILDTMLGLSATRAEQLSILQVCDRAIVVFIVLIAYVRIGKKRFLGAATAFDAILVIMIGSIASRAICGTAPFIASRPALSFSFWLIGFFLSSRAVHRHLAASLKATTQ